jgi:hypothetical protein
MFRKNALVLLVCCLVAAEAAPAKRQVLKLKNGNELTGEVEKIKAGYRITTASGLTTVIPADDVVSVEDVVTPEDEYKERLAKVDSKDAAARFAIGKWAFTKGYLEIARKELQEALKLKSDYGSAQVLLKRVEAKIAEEQAATTRPVAVNGEPAAGGVKVTAKHLMGPADINRIRVAELRATDKVPLALRNRVVQRFIEMMRGRGDFAQPGFEEKFLRYSHLDKALYIRDEVGESNYAIKDDIQVRADPKVMVDFRTQVWPLISRRCAAADCHGGPNGAGNLRLLTPVGFPQRVHYTNFYILEHYKRNRLSMIDRDTPGKSLLFQYGLPEKIAEFRHPGGTITPIFRDRDDPAYKKIFDWIDSLSGPPFRGYGLKYRLPWEKPAVTPPATVPPAPTTRPASSQ